MKYIEISIKQCKSGGIDCRVHGLAVMGKIVDDFGDPASSVSFLASDNEDVEVSICSSLCHSYKVHVANFNVINLCQSSVCICIIIINNLRNVLNEHNSINDCLLIFLVIVMLYIYKDVRMV